MIKKILIAGAMSLALTLPSFAQTLEQAAASTYKLYAGTTPLCSGVFVKSSKGGEDLYLTAAHCGNKKNYNVRVQVKDKEFNVISEQVFYLTPVRTLKSRDVMVFKTSDNSHKFNVAELASKEEAESLKLGTKLSTIGFPLAQELTVTHGEFMSLAKSKMSAMKFPFYKNTVPSTKGSSGGGLWMYTKNGLKVVGIVSHGHTSVGFMNMSATYQSIMFALGSKFAIDPKRFD